MKTMKFLKSVFAVLLIVLNVSCTESFIDPVSEEDYTSLKSTTLLLNDDGTLAGDVTEDDISSLLFVYEEEKMARDVYLYLYDMYQSRVFSNIANSEETHMDQVLNLIEGYGIENTGSLEFGVFNNEDIQSIYDGLIADGSVSLEEALKVGAFIEEFDIVDLVEWAEVVSNENIKIVYGNLHAGSENHLRAFVRNLSNIGVGYEPELLDEVYYAEILSGTSGNGNGNRRGKN